MRYGITVMRPETGKMVKDLTHTSALQRMKEVMGAGFGSTLEALFGVRSDPRNLNASTSHEVMSRAEELLGRCR